MAKIILEKDLGELIFELARKNKVVAPVEVHPHSPTSRLSFEVIDDESTLALNYGTTILPPKEFLLPPKEALFEYTEGKATLKKDEKMILFGLSLEDLEGTSLLSKVFAAPYIDLPLKRRFENTVFVAIDRFSPPKNVFYDLYLMKVAPERYAGFAGTKAGQEILRNELFKTQNIKIPRVSRKKDELLTDPLLPEAIEKSKKHPVWKELAEICFGCGICSYTCPLCYCFEMEDTLPIAGKEGLSGERCRSWDSCMLPHFAETTAGNFRPELEDRIYNWYFHKFVRVPREYGFQGCVDCNRCVIYCPAKINYRKVLERVLSDYKKKVKK